MDRTKQFQLDSFKLRIPYTKVKILNPSLEGKWITVNTSTGEVDPLAFKKDSLRFNDNGIKTSYGIENQVTKDKTTCKFLVILVNSKTLKEKYFEGITLSNIEEVYKYLMSQKVVSFTYKDFLSSELTDVDFMKDSIVTESFDLLVNGLYEFTRERSKTITKKYLKKDNKGIQWSDRKSSEISLPFFKVYYKSMELVNKSGEFFNEYFNPLDESNRIRIEFTVKNKSHFRSYGVKKTTLKNILSLSSNLKSEMFEKIVNKHIEIYEVKPVKVKTSLHASDKITLGLIGFSMQTKLVSFDSLLDLITSDIENRSQKSSKKKELKLLWTEHLKPYMIAEEKEGKTKDFLRKFLFS